MTFSKRPNNRKGWHFVITLAIRVIILKKLGDPFFEKKGLWPRRRNSYSQTIWDLFDLSLLFSQLGIRKHSGYLHGFWLLRISAV
jgi:hypothetical protein